MIFAETCKDRRRPAIHLPAVDNINAGDTTWVLVSAALVMLMTPALGFFYGGLVRQKNVLSTVMHSFFILCLISVQWVLWGYTLAFGPDANGWGIVGNLRLGRAQRGRRGARIRTTRRRSRTWPSSPSR